MAHCRLRENAQDAKATVVHVRHADAFWEAEVPDDDPPELSLCEGEPQLSGLKGAQARPLAEPLNQCSRTRSASVLNLVFSH